MEIVERNLVYLKGQAQQLDLGTVLLVKGDGSVLVRFEKPTEYILFNDASNLVKC